MGSGRETVAELDCVGAASALLVDDGGRFLLGGEQEGGDAVNPLEGMTRKLKKKLSEAADSAMMFSLLMQEVNILQRCLVEARKLAKRNFDGHREAEGKLTRVRWRLDNTQASRDVWKRRALALTPKAKHWKRCDADEEKRWAQIIMDSRNCGNCAQLTVCDVTRRACPQWTEDALA